MPNPTPAPEFNADRNPAMSDEGTHVALPRFQFVGGMLRQLWWPCDGVSGPEWRDVVSDDVPPMPEPDA